MSTPMRRGWSRRRWASRSTVAAQSGVGVVEQCPRPSLSGSGLFRSRFAVLGPPACDRLVDGRAGLT